MKVKYEMFSRTDHSAIYHFPQNPLPECNNTELGNSKRNKRKSSKIKKKHWQKKVILPHGGKTLFCFQLKIWR
jgi:hypothetical protein